MASVKSKYGQLVSSIEGYTNRLYRDKNPETGTPCIGGHSALVHSYGRLLETLADKGILDKEDLEFIFATSLESLTLDNS